MAKSLEQYEQTITLIHRRMGQLQPVQVDQLRQLDLMRMIELLSERIDYPGTGLDTSSGRAEAMAHRTGTLCQVDDMRLRGHWDSELEKEICETPPTAET